MEPLFVYSDSDITMDHFLEKIEFEEGNETTRSFFYTLLRKEDPQKLEKIVLYLTVSIFAA